MKILQINSVFNYGSTGKIVYEIDKLLSLNNIESYVIYARNNRKKNNNKQIYVGSQFDLAFHGLATRLFDLHGRASYFQTKRILRLIKKINPDIIHLHNVHGYYLNINLLFKEVNSMNKKIVWTLHDCWGFTGHCSHFESINCYKWIDGCHNCPKTIEYPSSLIDNSKNNYLFKKELLENIKNLQIVTPSIWLKENVKKSFLKNYDTTVIYNGIDLDVFQPSHNIPHELVDFSDKFIILGVANIFNYHKGFDFFLEFSKHIPSNYFIFLIGLESDQIKVLPKNIKGIKRTESSQKLAEFYSSANVFLNPTLEDTFPTVNIESLACGTPVITFRTGGSPEIIDDNTGFVVDKNSVKQSLLACKKIEENGKLIYTEVCRKRAILLFNKNDRYMDYIKLYEKI